MDILCYLVERRGRAVAREDILKDLWGLDRQTLLATECDGTRHTLAAAQKAGVKKVVYTSTLVTTPISQGAEHASLSDAPDDSRFAASVAAYGQLLRGGQYTGTYSYDDVITLANEAKGKDAYGYRAAFINLVRLAKSAADM